jgi:phage tail tape-measure protein
MSILAGALAGLKAAQYASLFIKLGMAVKEGVEGAREAADLVEQMVAEGRDPTQEEWDKLEAATQGYINRMEQAIRDAEEAEESSEG